MALFGMNLLHVELTILIISFCAYHDGIFRVLSMTKPCHWNEDFDLQMSVFITTKSF